MENNRKTTKKRILRALSFVTLLLAGLLTNLAYGQGGTTGAISGIVTDSTGAAIPRAQVQATNITTGVANTTQSNDAGVYTFPYLQVGQYEVKFAAKGMKESVVTGIRVDEANISRVDGKLAVGAASETVNVTESVPLIEQETPTIDASVDKKLIDDLPSVAGGGTRSATDVLNLLPGVATPGASSGNSYGSQFGVNIGGGRQFGTEFQIDGMVLAYSGGSGVPLDMRPDYDVVSEAKVLEGVPTAEFGRTSGGVATFLTRSGSNSLHGDAGVFIKNTIFDAHPYNTDTVTTDQNWELPLSVGGPIYIPWLYDGRNKSFFFASLDYYRQKNAGIPGTVTVPTQQERGLGGADADFSDQPNTIYDPTTGLPFPGNKIPNARIDSVASMINAFYPLPTTGGLSANLTGFTPQSALQNDQFVRVDQQFTSKNHFMASYRHRNEPSVYAEGGPMGPDLSGDLSPRSLHQDTAQDDWTITPHIVNHMAAGDIGFYTAQLSAPQDPKYWIPVPGSYGAMFPHFCFQTQAYQGLGEGLGSCTPGQVDGGYNRTDGDFQDTLFWNKGAHSIKVGARFLLFGDASFGKTTLNGAYAFSGAETAQVVDGTPQVDTTGNSYASFLLGLVDNANMAIPDNGNDHSKYFGWYVEDAWRASQKLSLTFGLRWDIMPQQYDSQNRYAEMDPTVPNPGAGNLPGSYVFAPQEHVRNFAPTYYGAWQPRFGAAYSVKPDLVVRASYGVLDNMPYYDGAFGDSTGYSGSKSVASFNGGVTPSMIWSQGWTNVPHPPDFDPTQNNGGAANIDGPNADHFSVANMWSLDVQKSLARDFAFTVGYVGSNNHHMSSSYPANQDNPGYLSLGNLLNASFADTAGTGAGGGLPALTAAGYNPPFPGFVTLYGAGATLAQALKPFPQYQSVSVTGNRVFGSNYNALLIKAEHHFSHDFQYLVSYTMSKNLTNVPLNVEYGYPGPQNAYDLRAEKYLATFDIPQILVISYTYALPFGPGERWLNHGFASNILGGWATSGILNYDGGIPIEVYVNNTLPIGNSRLNAQYLGGSTTKSHGKVVIAGDVGHDPGTVTLNSAAFAQPAAFTFGNSYVLPSTRTVGFKSENASFFKRETFHERYIFELRFDMINLPNRKDPAHPDTGLTDAEFGQYTGSAIGPRNCQFDAKFSF